MRHHANGLDELLLVAAVVKTVHVNPTPLLCIESNVNFVDAIGFDGRKVIDVNIQRPIAKEDTTISDALDHVKGLILEIDPEDMHGCVLKPWNIHDEQLT
jgi:hypothetical protein